MLWKEDYALGVEQIDRQHRELFTVINRITQILQNEDFERNRRTCVEAIKYLKSYALRHFADEEAYQLEIGYEGYPRHKRQHEMFVETIGELERDMTENQFSRDSIRRFTGALTSWLVYHIMDSDQAIVRGGYQAPRGGATEVLETMVTTSARDMFGTDLHVSNSSYAGGLSGSEILCLTECVSQRDGGRLCVLTALDEAVAVGMVAAILDFRPDGTDELVLSAIRELSILLSMGFAEALPGHAGYRVASSVILDSPDALAGYTGAEPLVSILFGSPTGNVLVRAWN